MPEHRASQDDIDLGRDVFMGHEFAAEVLEVGPDTVGRRAGHDRHVDPGPAVDDRRAADRVLERRPRRLRRADAAVGADAARGAQRARPPPRRAHRADGRRAARREPLGDRGRRRRARARVRPGRPGRHRRAEAARASSRSWRPTSRRPGARLAVDDGRPRGRRPARGAGVRGVGAGSAAAGRSSCSRPSACPGSSTTPCGPRRRARRIVVVGVCMERDTITPFFGIGKELDISFVPRLRPDGVRRRRCGRSPRARSTSTPMITGEVDLDGVARRLRRARQPRASTARSSSCRR